MKQVYITQGEDAVSDNPGVVISTVLGSCVSICLWDSVSRVGGMNHLLLPEMTSDSEAFDSVGAISMERLINQMVRLGAVRERLTAKVFGGASMLSGLTDIGARNTAFSREYLLREGIACHAESTGGTSARRIKFFPASGNARQRYVQKAPDLVAVSVPKPQEIELF